MKYEWEAEAGVSKKDHIMKNKPETLREISEWKSASVSYVRRQGTVVNHAR